MSRKTDNLEFENKYKNYNIKINGQISKNYTITFNNITIQKQKKCFQSERSTKGRETQLTDQDA